MSVHHLKEVIQIIFYKYATILQNKEKEENKTAENEEGKHIKMESPVWRNILHICCAITFAPNLYFNNL